MALLFSILVVLVLLALLVLGYFVVLMVKYPAPVSAAEVYTITTADGWAIRLYRRAPRQNAGEPVFLCHSLTANHLNFELPEGHSLVDMLTRRGFDCWSVDLRGCASSVPPQGALKNRVTMDDYLFRDIPAALDHIRRVTGHDRVHWVGHSLGGMLLYAYAVAVGKEHLGACVTLGSPVGLSRLPYKRPARILSVTELAPWLVSTLLKGLTPLAPALRPVSPFVPINWGNVHPGMNAGAFFNLVEMPPSGVLRELDAWISGGKWTVKNDTVDVTAKLNTLDVPLMAVFGGSDPLTPSDQIEEFFEALPTKDKQLLVLSRGNGASADYGHIDLTLATRGPAEVYEPIAAWLEAHPAGAAQSSAKRAPARKTAAKPAPKPKATAAKPKAAARPKAAPKKAPAKKPAAAKKPATTKKPAARKAAPRTRKTGE